MEALPKAGDDLRDNAAKLLASKLGSFKIEARTDGKKADVFFEIKEFGRTRKLYVEAKDWTAPLRRTDVVHIWSDYSGIVQRIQPAELLIITRNGLTADADQFVNVEQGLTRHQTILDLEREVLGLNEYVRSLTKLSSNEGTQVYYVGSLADATGAIPANEGFDSDLLQYVQRWIEEPNEFPIAVLGGYGAGKTTFSKMLISQLAKDNVADPTKRVPIYLRLGMFSRHTSVESMIANMFSVEHNIPGFSVHTFFECNSRGRFVIVCDGFDEMKHAMSWSDFRSTMAEINKFTGENSKLVLLGRPSAFMSEQEHFHILRGQKKFAYEYQKMSSWPTFQEFTLRAFTEQQLGDFIEKYLRYLALSNKIEFDGGDVNQFVETRAETVRGLAKREGEIFSKPVHAQILTELAATPAFDIARFGARPISRWSLYEAFFQRLCERENEKVARRQVAEADRLGFLRELAYWLWTERDGQTSFSLDAIPDRIFKSLPDGDADDYETKAREYLTGAFLEKKHGDIYFFGHRSFAEFLVADRLLNIPPKASDHARYSECLKGAVLDFFEEGLGNGTLDTWASTLGDWSQVLDMDYLRLLAKRCGGLRKLRRLMSSSLLKSILECFDDRVIYGNVFESRAVKLIKVVRNQGLLMVLQFLDISFGTRELSPKTLDKAVLQSLAYNLWHNPVAVQPALRHDTSRGVYRVNGKLLRQIVATSTAQAAIVDSAETQKSIGWPDSFEVPAGQRLGLLGFVRAK